MEAAVAGYAEGVLKSSVGKLGSFLLNEAWLIANVREDIISIRDELQSMDAVLRDLICAKQLNQQSKVWMLHVLQVACDAELCIDEFAEILGGHCGHGLTGAARRAARFTSTVFIRHSIAKTIQGLNVRAKELSERRARYNTTIQTNMPDAIELTRRAHVASRHLMQNWHVIAEDELVGIDSETRSSAMQLASKLGVTVIVGPAGSGKTALAKMVYRRRNVPNNGIKAYAWVTLSENPDTKRVLKDILMQVNGFDEDTEKHDDVEVENKLRNHLDKKRFLLVLDSLQSLKDLVKLKEAFPESSEGTIVATSRNIDDVDVAHSNVKKIDIKQFTSQARKDLCAKLLLNLTSATQNRYQWLMNIGDFCWMIWKFCWMIWNSYKKFESYSRQVVPDYSWFLWNSFKRFGDLLRRVWNWFSERHWFRVFLKMVEIILIMYQVPHIVMSIVRTYIHNWAFTMLILALYLVNKRFTRFLGDHPLEYFLGLVLLIPSLVIWNLFQGKVWLALFEVTHIVVFLLYHFIKRSGVIVTIVKPRKMVFYLIWMIIHGIIVNLYYFLRRIIRQVVSLLDTYIVGQVEQIVYKYQTRVKGFPLNRVRYYHRLTGSAILKVNALVPLEIKFICGALTSQRMDSNKVNEFFEELDELATKANNEERLNALTLTCYNLMSQSLKQCAQDLHKELPECYAVKRKRITRQWIARELASPKQGQGSEEVAECYFDELQVRGFIEPESVYPTGKTKTCRINSVFKAIDPTILNSNETSRDNQQKDIVLAPSSHLSPSSTVREGLRKNLELKYSNRLTVLDLEGCRDLEATDMSILCRFVELRFLSLKNTNIVKVPPNIGKLKQLETLDIRQTQIKKVPKNILNLKQLKRLFAGYFYKPEIATDDSDKYRVRSIELPMGVEEMSNLETLAHVNATRNSGLLISVQELTQLKKLGLVIREDKLNPRPLCISLMMLSDSLRSLSICDERQPAARGRVHSLDFLEYLCFPPLNLNSLTLSGYLRRLPQWVSNHKLLCKLTLANTQLMSNAIRLIGKIPTLLCLKLYRDSYDEYCLDLELNEFAVLKVLIVQCDAIQMIRFAKGTTTKLEVFRWVFSRAQTGEVSGIKNLPLLKEVSLIGDIDAVLEKNIKEAVVKHSNWNTTLVFEKIVKNIPESNA